MLLFKKGDIRNLQNYQLTEFARFLETRQIKYIFTPDHLDVVHVGQSFSLQASWNQGLFPWHFESSI